MGFWSFEVVCDSAEAQTSGPFLIPHPNGRLKTTYRICASADPDIHRSRTTKSFSSCRFSWGENGSGWKSGAILGRRTNPQLEKLARDGNGRVYQFYCYISSGFEKVRSDAKAVQWVRKAAAQRHAPSQFHLGFYLKEGLYGVDKNTDQGIVWLKKAAAPRHITAIIELDPDRYYEELMD